MAILLIFPGWNSLLLPISLTDAPPRTESTGYRSASLGASCPCCTSSVRRRLCRQMLLPSGSGESFSASLVLWSAAGQRDPSPSRRLYSLAKRRCHRCRNRGAAPQREYLLPNNPFRQRNACLLESDQCGGGKSTQ